MPAIIFPNVININVEMQKQKKFRHVEIRMFHYLWFELISILKLRIEMKYSTIVQIQSEFND